MSHHRVRPDAGWVSPKRLPRGPNGRPCCRRCGQEVPRGRRTFCGDQCVHEWRLQTDPGYVRQKVWERDHGICRVCGLDTANWRGATEHRRTLGFYWWRRQSAWEADHIVPVVEGGGGCGLEGYRTLCLDCHRRVTAELARRRAEQRARERAEARGPAQPMLPGIE